MTKRKAIEAAIDRWEGTGFWRVEEDARSLADFAYEAGRIAGLREAASKINPGYDDPESDDVDAVIYEALIGHTLDLRSHANALAKKARAKAK